MATHHRPRHVGILVDTDDPWGRTIVEAVCRFGRSRGWTVLIAPRDSQGRLRLPRVWNGDGIIASLRTASSVRHVKALNLPVVDVGNMVPQYDWLARVATDDAARGRMAFEPLRDRAPGGITVANLLQAFPVSRRRLEQRFREELNRSPAEEIGRVRMAHVGRLLLDTDKPVAAIASEAGFATPASLSQAFRQYFGTTPGEYQRRNRTS